MPTLLKAQKLVKQNIHGMRKGVEMPRYVHSLRVGEELKALGYDEHVYIAGTLHDIIEDSECDADQLYAAGFSKEVVELVELCSHDSSIKNKNQRRFALLDAIIQAQSRDAFAIKTVDFLDNIKEPYAPDGYTQRAHHILFKKGILLQYYAHSYLPNTDLHNKLNQTIFDYHKILYDHDLESIVR